MMNTRIEWADHTFNPWIGCTKVSAGCAHCYAETLDARFKGGHWGKGAPRKLTSPANWKLPLKWNRKAAETGTRPRVFCASMADVFDDEVDPAWREHTLRLIERTINLTWLVLTKRPQNVKRMLYECGIDYKAPLANLWLGTSVENQAAADERIPQLLEIPARKRFLSCEPLLGPVDLNRTATVDIHRPGGERSYTRPLMNHAVGEARLAEGYEVRGGIDWVIAGGESGPGARPMHPDWARSLRDQCQAAGVAFHFKQWGEWAPARDLPGRPSQVINVPHVTIDSNGSEVEAGARVYRVGKKRAGRLLDGREWNEVPHA